MSVTITAAACVPSDPIRTIRTGAAGRARKALTPRLVNVVWLRSGDTRERLVHAQRPGGFSIQIVAAK